MRRIISVLFMLTVPVLLYSQKECSQAAYTQESPDKIFIPFSSVSERVSSIVSTTLIAVPEEIVIPVVVHLINGNRLGITDEQVHSQIAALNRDFNGRNADLANVPLYFAPLAGNSSIRFELAKVDPGGKATNGIVRKESGVQNFGLDDRIKFSSQGGDNAWPRDHYLNIWVSSLVNGIQGYSTFPGSAAEVDGVVLNSTVFGTIGKTSRYNMGRIAVHEVGHWLGLKHIWGDGYCGDDGIDDTPQQKSYNKGNPTGIIRSCGTDPTGDMYMNFMDLTDDVCMKMFTRGQANKMRSAFEAGGPRNALLASGAFDETGRVIDSNWNVSIKEKSGMLVLKGYPNPAVSEIRVELESEEVAAVKSLRVYNMVGQLMITVPVNAKVVLLNISGLRSGHYFIQTDQPLSKPLKMVKL